MKKFLLLLGILLVIFGCFLLYDIYNDYSIPTLDIEEENILINNIYIYGTHLNINGKYNLNEELEFVLYNGNFLTYDINISNNNFSLSDYINDGLYLDDIPKGDYYMFLRSKYTVNDETKYKYYALNNSTDYQETTYYSMSDYSKKIVIKNENKYPTMMLTVSKVKNNDVYDIVIDPGHGGRDGGASKYGYSETDFTMDIAIKLKSILTDYGFKVKLTHNKGQLLEDEKLPEYGVHGRAIIPREVNAKYLFSIHLNSSNYSDVNGLEVYTAKNINYDFAKLLVNNIISNTGINYSNNKINKIDNSIYSRNFTQEEVNDTIQDYKNEELLPYDVSTNSNYYYMIRETGGIVTGAYVDNRNSKIIGNPYTDSNVGTEAYLLELGYISNKYDLNNMINNIDKFVLGIADSIKTLYTFSN